MQCLGELTGCLFIHVHELACYRPGIGYLELLQSSRNMVDPEYGLTSNTAQTQATTNFSFLDFYYPSRPEIVEASSGSSVHGRAHRTYVCRSSPLACVEQHTSVIVFRWRQLDLYEPTTKPRATCVAIWWTRVRLIVSSRSPCMHLAPMHLATYTCGLSTGYLRPSRKLS